MGEIIPTRDRASTFLMASINFHLVSWPLCPTTNRPLEHFPHLPFVRQLIDFQG